MRAPLPIDDSIDRIRHHLERARAVVIVAPPGAGKTTRVPPALAGPGPVLVLQPRRAAARAIARRIAEEEGWTLGHEVGWHVRFECRASRNTRVLVATEGILTARLQRDPLASGFATIVLDEFHERSIHADLGLALARQAWQARDDLRLVVMSATIDAGPVAAFLGGCPIVDVPVRPYPLEIEYAPGESIAAAVARAAMQSATNVLCFLPGAPEIRRDMPAVASALPGYEIVALHGSLEAEEQDRALAAGTSRRVILATNMAETSVTVPGVEAIVDSGLHKVARYDAARAIDSLSLERIPVASADQRAGRAARLGPGRAIRLWDSRDRLRKDREPDIQRIDLAGTLLDLAAWGADPRVFEWFEAPPADASERAWRLLERLGAVEGRTLTPLGRRMQRFPVHPRLARMLIDAGGAFEACAACALLSERAFLPPGRDAVSCDLLPALDAWRDVPAHVRQVARAIEAAAADELGSARRPRIDEDGLRRAIYAGYPDRLARRRDERGRRLVLASGTGATLSPASGVDRGELLVALDVQRRDTAAPGKRASVSDNEPAVRLASRVEREWITPTSVEVEHVFDAAAGRARAIRRERVDALVVSEQAVAVEPEAAARLMAAAWLERGPRGADLQLVRRLSFAGMVVDLPALVTSASLAARTIDEIDLRAQLQHDQARALDRDAPEHLTVPTGRRVRLTYEDDGSVSAGVPLQELFGLQETPRLGLRKEPVVLHLLAPNGRPVQMTRDLRSFWTRIYPEVRKELRGRYPRHAWPEDPTTAQPTSKPRPRTRPR
jgi:ATP-dependent helicase HrpB